ncbi:MAG: hypothetical protein LBU82_05930 [Treponema sp.]|nr:hypothetical protein [Treponema sp.]
MKEIITQRREERGVKREKFCREPCERKKNRECARIENANGAIRGKNLILKIAAPEYGLPHIVSNGVWNGKNEK